MPTNPGQGNTTQGNYVNFPAGGTTTNVYVYTAVATPVVGSSVFWTSDGSVSAPAGTYKITLPTGVKRNITVNASGVVTAILDCVWTSTKYNNSTYTATKNDCSTGSCSSYGSTVTLNDNGSNIYTTSGYAESTVSQADADSQAQAIADAAFNAGKQAKINEYGTCTYTYSSGSAPVNYYCNSWTRNNCAANCYGTSYQTCSSAKSGYSYTSSGVNSSCQAAIDGANAAAQSAAINEVNAAGQNNANTYGGCCCWVSAPGCVPSSCNYMGDRQQNTCTGEYRYTNITGTSCSCGESCGGSYFEYSCGGQYNYDQYRQEKWSCTGNIKTGNALYQSCSASCNANSTPVFESKGYTTCYNCTNANVYQDINHCSGTSGGYYVYYNGYVSVGGQPTGGSCYTTSSCQDTGSAYCSGANYVINRTQGNPCSQEGCSSPRVIEYNSTTYGCYTPPSCTLYELYMYGGYSEYVYVNYTPCSGGSSTMSAYNDGGGGYGGQVCAQNGTAYISSGSGALINQGSCS